MKITLALLALTASVFATTPPEFSDVLIAGKDGFPAIRIPSVVVTKSGTVLAFAEGRKAPHADQAGNEIILKRSRDGGRTWGAMQTTARDGANSLNNPTALVEQNSGRVWLMYQSIPGQLKEASKQTETGYEGTNVYRNYFISSDDDGATWSQPLNVTRSTKRPTGATTIASGPGIGIQLTRGPHAGRMIIPFNEGPFWQWNNYAVFSDDRGATWQCGENVPGALITDAKGKTRSQINEVQMVELADGSVRLNSRQFAGAKVRKTSVSHDGGATWSPVEDVTELRDPSCMASIFRLTFPAAGVKSQILYSGPNSTKRENGTVHLSYDEGKTWPVSKVLFPGSFAYSVLTVLPDGTLGCLFETDGTDRMVFARFTLDWLTEDNAALATNTATKVTTGENSPLRQADVFVSGTDGYKTYRIPAAVVTTKGTVLALSEGRKIGGGDSGDIDLVLKRSTDGAQTWSGPQVVWDDAENTCGNPCPVVDRETGVIWLLTTWNRGDDHERQIIDQTSKDSRRIFISSSSDDGHTWSAPREITPNVKRTNWTWYATGPGAGIQLEKGSHKGRLVIPCDHIEAGTRKYFSHVIYSDDHGKNWQLGGSSPADQVNESEVVELSDGRLLLNMRNYDKAERTRQVCFSDDGGLTWQDQRHDVALIEPICQASVRRVSWPAGDQPGILLFANPASSTKREKLTVRLSRDEGQTWPSAKEIYSGSSAYSCLIALPGDRVGCFYEADGYQRIVLAEFPLGWMTNNAAVRRPGRN